MLDAVAPPQQSVYRLGIEQGVVKGFKHVVDDAYGILFTSVEVGFLRIQVGDLGIDGDDGIGKLKHIGERIDEPIATDKHIAASSRLVPPIAVTAEEDGRAGGVVEKPVDQKSALR